MEEKNDNITAGPGPESAQDTSASTLKSSQKTVNEKEIVSDPPRPLKSDADKTRTNVRLPKPVPHEPSTIKPEEYDEPISSETISIKRSALREEKPKIVEEKRVLKISCWHCSQKLDLTELESFSKINCPSCNVEIIIPKWFDNYLLEEPGGQGGMAIVYRALDLTLDREVAIKVLNSDVASKEERKRLFLHEARTAATLNHYSVLPIYTCGEYERQPYIVMQYMDGGSLDFKLDESKGRLPILDVIKWIKDIAEALDNARRHGIVHHDVKPANLMLDKDGNVKIGDFGIAQAIHDAKSKDLDELTKYWSSPHYVSPEKVSNGSEEYTGDIYSLGATFYHLISGQPPFDSEDVKKLLKMRLESDPVDPRKLRPEIPEAIASLVMAMLSKSPDFRPSYRDIIHTLEKFIKDEEARQSKKAKTGAKAQGRDGKLDTLKKSRKVDRSAMEPAFARAAAERDRNHMKAMLMGAAAVIAIGAVVMWQMGFFETRSITAGVSSGYGIDYLPDVTNMLQSGNSKSAAQLAESTLNDGSANIKARKQAAIQMSLANYLNNNPHARNVCGVIVQQLTASGVDDKDPAVAIAKYLSSSDIPPERLQGFLGGDRNLQLLASMAIFLKQVYDKAPEADVVKSSQSLSMITSSESGQVWVNAWRDRIPAWNEWMNSGSGNADALEPLISSRKFDVKLVEVKKMPANTQKRVEKAPETEWNVAGLDSIELDQLNIEWLKKNRKFAEARPRPASYTFTSDEMKEYLSKLPEDKKAAEEKRLEQVSSVKQYVCTCMMRIPFESSSIRLVGGQVLKGTVMANDKYLSIRIGGGNKRINWSELSFDTLADIMAFYAKTRLDAFGGANVNDSNKKFEAAWDYLRIGIMADWYGHYGKSVEYTKKAVAIDPRISSDAKKYIMY